MAEKKTVLVDKLQRARKLALISRILKTGNSTRMRERSQADLTGIKETSPESLNLADGGADREIRWGYETSSTEEKFDKLLNLQTLSTQQGIINRLRLYTFPKGQCESTNFLQQGGTKSGCPLFEF